MKFKSIIASVVLVAFVSTQTFAQEAQSQPKYDNDLDRAMCVFSSTLKKESKLWQIFTGVGLVGTEGSLFYVWKVEGFKTEASEMVNTVTDFFFENAEERQAFQTLVGSKKYFRSMKGTEGLELSSTKAAPFRFLQQMSSKDINLKQILSEVSYGSENNKIYFLGNVAAKLDGWIPNNGMNIQKNLKTRMIETAMKHLPFGKIEHLQELRNTQVEFRKSFNRPQVLWVSLAVLYLAITAYSLKEFADAQDELVAMANYDMAEVRNYFSQPDHESDLNFLVEQSKTCGCY